MKANAKFINAVRIEGYVYSTGSNFNQLSERVTGEKSKHPGTKYIAGDLDIAVDEAGLNVVTVHYAYVTETYKSGQTNNTYTALKKIIDNARNTFSADMLITKVIHVDADPERNIDRDYATINGAIFGYGPVILPVSFVIRNENGMKYFENLDASPSEPVFTKLWGRVNCLTIKTERVEPSAFGEAAVQTYERKSREFLVTGAAKVPYDFGDENILTQADVNKMTQARQVLLAEVENRFNERKMEKTSNESGFEASVAAIPVGKFVY